MSIGIQCPRCQQQYNVDDKLAGKKVKCKGCSSPISVPLDQAEVLELDTPGGGSELPFSSPAPAPAQSSAAGRSASGRQLRVQVNRCPSCTAILSEGAVICTLCGMNLQTGQKEQVQNFLDSGPGDDTGEQKRWFRRRGSPVLESADELLKLALIIFTLAGIGIWVWRLYKGPWGITVGGLIPLAVVLALLAGVIAPLAAFAVNTTVKLLKFIPRGDTYWRIALALMLPLAGSLAAGFPGMEQSLDFLIPSTWLAGIGLLVFFLRAELIEWMLSVVTAVATICVSWLVLAGITTSAARSAPLYVEMLPGAPWNSFATMHAPPPPEKPSNAIASGNSAATKNAGNPTPVSPSTTPPTIAQNPTPPQPPVNPNPAPTDARPTPTSPTGVAANDPGTGTNATATTSDVPTVVKVASPFLGEVVADAAPWKSINDVIVPTMPSPYFLVTRTEGTSTIVERWSSSPLEKKGEASFPYFARKPATYALSPKGDVLVALSYFPRSQLEFVYFDRSPKKTIALDAQRDPTMVDAMPTLLGFVGPGQFLLRWDRSLQTRIQIWNVVTGVPTTRVIAPEPLAASQCSVALSPNGRLLATVARDRNIVIYDVATSQVQRRILPSNLPYKLVHMAFSPDSAQIALYAVISDTPTVVSFKVQNGETVASAVLATVPQVDEEPVIGAREKSDFLWLQGTNAWLVNGTELIDSGTGRKVGEIEATGISARRQVGPGQMVFLAREPGEGLFRGLTARLEEAKLRSAIDKLR